MYADVLDLQMAPGSASWSRGQTFFSRRDFLGLRTLPCAVVDQTILYLPDRDRSYKVCPTRATISHQRALANVPRCVQ